MAQQKNTTDINALLWTCLNQEDFMLFLLDWLCKQLMEAEVSHKMQAAKSERTEDRTGYRSGYRPRRFDTRMGTLYLLVPKVRNGGYIPFFLTERKRSEAALIQVVQEAFVRHDTFNNLVAGLKNFFGGCSRSYEARCRKRATRKWPRWSSVQRPWVPTP